VLTEQILLCVNSHATFVRWLLILDPGAQRRFNVDPRSASNVDPTSACDVTTLKTLQTTGKGLANIEYWKRFKAHPALKTLYYWRKLLVQFLKPLTIQNLQEGEQNVQLEGSVVEVEQSIGIGVEGEGQYGFKFVISTLPIGSQETTSVTLGVVLWK